MNKDINKLSMADEDDYDEYEEEVIERDEEYDDGDEYDEEYDDEDYEDEEYDDEEYEEEEPYDEEYDEGYDDQYYDDRLNQVLDELAELKRNMAPAVQQQPVQQPFLPIQPHMMIGMPQNNEVVMYNEISRLREELSKTQNSQVLHEELGRLKEEMERDKRQNEAQFLSEIKRLNERIEELQAPDKSKPALGATQTAGYLPEAGQHASAASASKEIGKLVGINETLLKSTRDSNAHILADIAELKTKVDSLSSSDNSDNVNKALNDIHEAIKAVDVQKDSAKVGDALAEVSASVAALKNSVEEYTKSADSVINAVSNSDNSGAVIDKKLLNKLARIKTENGNVDLTEVMRSVYELKGMLGSGDANQQALVNMALRAYTDLDLLHATIANSNDFRTKLEAVENFVSSVNSQDFITADALTAYNIVLKDLLNTPLDHSVFDSLNSFAAATGKITISSSKKDAVNKYINLAERAKKEDVDNVIAFLPDLVSAINDAEGSKNVASFSALLDDINSVYAERNKAAEADKFAAETEIKALVCELTNLTVGDIVTYSPGMPLPTSDAVTFAEGDSVSDRINMLIQSVNDISSILENLSVNSQKELPGEDDDVAATTQPHVEFESGTVGMAGSDIDELRAMLSAIDAKINIDELSGELQRNFRALSGKLADIENRLANDVVSVQTEQEYSQEENDSNIETVATDNYLSSEIAESISEIKDKLSEQDMFISQIGDLRADILAIPETIGLSGQFDKLYEDVVSQFDKLYDDLTAVEGEVSEKLVAKLDEMKTVIDGISASDMSAALIDTIVDFRTSYEDSQALSAADREKLLQDVAFVRAGVEQRLAEKAEESVRNEDIASQIETLQSEVSENLKALEDKLSALEVSENSAVEQSAQSSGEISAKLDNVAAVLDELKEKSSALEDTVNTNGLLVADNQNTVTDSINRIIELLSPAEDEEGTNVYDEIIAISAKVDEVNSVYNQYNADIQAALSDIKEQIHLKELEQSLEKIPVSEEEQNKLLSEISELRERLSGLESLQQTQSDSINAQLEHILSQVSAIAEIKESLGENAETSSEIVRMQDDITFIRNQIEATIESAPEDDTISETLENEGLSLIMDDIAAIKEKLTALDEYDTVAEILSLREDVKTARLLDNSDVAAELESLKGDLMELKADISDIKSVHDGAEAVEIPSDGVTGDEVNMLLSEIVSLRDEIQAYKDDVNNVVSLQDDIQPATAVADENIAVILDELTGLHNEIDNIKIENLAEQASEINEIRSALSEIKDMIARRTTIAEDGAARDSAVSNELNVVLDEIINVKSDVAALQTDLTTMRETAAAERESDAQAEKAAFADELQSLKSELYSMIGEKLEELSLVSPDFSDELQSVKDQLADLQAIAVGGVLPAEDTAASGIVLNELNEIKEMLLNRGEQPVQAEQPSVSMEELYAEVIALRQEMEESRNSAAVLSAGNAEVTVDMSEVNEQLAAIREQLASPTVAAAEMPDEAVLGEVLSLREEIAALKEQLDSMSVASEQAQPDTMVLGEILSLREELTAIREQMSATAGVQPAEQETDTILLNEILGLREEIENMRVSSVSVDETAGIIESIDTIKEDVRTIKEEPDLSIINEVLALRDEFQAFKDELNKTRTAPVEDKSKEELIGEVQSLRDQLFAISMANVNDGTSNEVVYESYNNIILDEISSLRDEIALIKQSDETNALGEELSQMKDKLTNLAIDDREKIETRFRELRDEIARLKDNAPANIDDTAILGEIASIKEELANQREADAATHNFMSEMARLLEKQSVYISQASNERLSDEIESLKAEIASSLAVPATSEDIKSEIESLKAELSRNRNNNAALDNSAVLKELASLRNEMNRRNSSVESDKILREISRLKDEIGVIAEREPAEDESLSQSINELKAELNNIAEFVGEENVKQPAAKKPTASRAKQGKKTGAKSAAKRKSRPKQKPAVMSEDSGLTSENLLSKIDSTTINLGGSSTGETIVLNPDFQPEAIPATSEEMDIAARIAKQVANKLIMEQLVQQLGDGSVPHSEVEEIVKDILPQEFTTIQVDEQTDKVRRLANSLVLDKLRSRLKK